MCKHVAARTAWTLAARLEGATVCAFALHHISPMKGVLSLNQLFSAASKNHSVQAGPLLSLPLLSSLLNDSFQTSKHVHQKRPFPDFSITAKYVSQAFKTKKAQLDTHKWQPEKEMVQG
jgi:hypothetical protein